MTSGGGGAKILNQVKWLKHVGARRGTAGWLCREPESTAQGGGLGAHYEIGPHKLFIFVVLMMMYLRFPRGYPQNGGFTAAGLLHVLVHS